MKEKSKMSQYGSCQNETIIQPRGESQCYGLKIHPQDHTTQTHTLLIDAGSVSNSVLLGYNTVFQVETY